MLIASWPLTEFAKFLQLLSWIIMPVLLLAVLLTVLMHYRQSRKNKKAEPAIDDGVILLSSPDSNATGDRKNSHVLLDHTGVIRQYQEKISYHHARYAALHQDFKVLETKYSSSFAPFSAQPIQIKKNEMEESIQQNPGAQSDFLQQQVNEQILIVYKLRLEHEELNKQLMHAMNSGENLQNELSAAKDEIKRQDMVIDHLRSDLLDKDKKFDAQAVELSGLNNLLHESKQQNNLFRNGIAANEIRIDALQEQLNLEEIRVVQAMEELQENRGNLKKMQDEILGKLMEPGNTQLTNLRSPFVNTDPVN